MTTPTPPVGTPVARTTDQSTPSDLSQLPEAGARENKATTKRSLDTFRTLLPGLVLSLAAAGVGIFISSFLTGVSALIVAILGGVLLTNTVGVPKVAKPGIAFASKSLLRLGIVLLGLQLALTDIVALGIPMLVVVVCIVVGGVVGSTLIGRALKVPPRLTTLISCGFSICGAAAVAGAAGVVDPEGEAEGDTVTAVALVVIFGTLMIPLVPLLAHWMGLDDDMAGAWAGGSVHEVAQVVAIGSILGGSALSVAVLVKLSRVLMMAPLMAVLSVIRRRQVRQHAQDLQTAGQQQAEPKLPPIVPLFVLGFLAMILLRTFVPLPQIVLGVGGFLQTLLLAAAMFGLGCGVGIRKLRQVGPRPFLLAALATVLVSTIAFVGVTLIW